MQLARGLDAGEDARHGLTTYAGRVRRRKVRELKDLVDVAKTAAARAATYLRGLTPAAPSDWTEKGPHDFVTDADRAAEALIATTLTSGVPGSTVVGEELSPGGPRSGDVVWIVDPLDGTTNFLHRYPQYAVSIGCAVNGALCVGVIHDIPRDVVYWGARGAGAWQGERRLRRTRPRRRSGRAARRLLGADPRPLGHRRGRGADSRGLGRRDDAHRRRRRAATWLAGGGQPDHASLAV